MFEIIQSDVSKNGAVTFTWKPSCVLDFQKNQIKHELFLLFRVINKESNSLTQHYVKCEANTFILQFDNIGVNTVQVFPFWSKFEPSETAILNSDNFGITESLIDVVKVNRVFNPFCSFIWKNDNSLTNNAMVNIEHIVHYNFTFTLLRSHFAKQNWIDNVLIEGGWSSTKDECDRRIKLAPVLALMAIHSTLEVAILLLKPLVLVVKILVLPVILLIGKPISLVRWRYFIRGSVGNMYSNSWMKKTYLFQMPLLYIAIFSSAVSLFLSPFLPISMLSGVLLLCLMLLLGLEILDAVENRSNVFHLANPNQNSSTIEIPNKALDYINGTKKPELKTVIHTKYQQLKVRVCKKTNQSN